MYKCLFLRLHVKIQELLPYWHWDKISMASPSLSYTAIVWGSLRLLLVGGLLHMNLITLFTTLSYASPLKLHPDLLCCNGWYSEREYAFHYSCLVTEPSPHTFYITHTRPPSFTSLQSLCIPPAFPKWKWQRKEPMSLKSFETPGIQMSWEASGNKTRHLTSKRQVNYYPNLGRITKGVSGVPLIALGLGPECQGFKLHTSFGLRPKPCHCRAQQHVHQC